MGRIRDHFAMLANQGRSALIPYVTAGDPDLATTRTIIGAAEAGGADLIEIGVPFSDPMADGPTLQRAFARSLEAGTTLPLILDLVADVRARSEMPIVLFGYYNPFFRYGLDRFAKDARAAGADGVLCVDLPPEEAGEFLELADGVGLDLVFLLAPTSGPARIRKVASVARGFIYVVSVTGVTGARTSLPEEVPELVAKVKSVTDLPVAVGFGIGRPEQAAWVASFSDAVVVGSALADLVERQPDRSTLPERVESFIGGLRRAMDQRGEHGRRTAKPAASIGARLVRAGKTRGKG